MSYDGMIKSTCCTCLCALMQKECGDGMSIMERSSASCDLTLNDVTMKFSGALYLRKIPRRSLVT
jgi:hypothetical protein